MKRIRNIIDRPWDKKETLREYILGSYYGGKRFSFIWNKVQKRYPNYFKNEAELIKWIEDNRPKSEFRSNHFSDSY
jgi:uncharacterized protein with HEPN domain